MQYQCRSGGGEGVRVQTTEEVRGSREERDSSGGQRKGEGLQCWAKLINQRVSDHTSNVCPSGPAEAVQQDTWRTLCHPLRQSLTELVSE